MKTLTIKRRNCNRLRCFTCKPGAGRRGRSPGGIAIGILCDPEALSPDGWTLGQFAVLGVRSVRRLRDWLEEWLAEQEKAEG